MQSIIIMRRGIHLYQQSLRFSGTALVCSKCVTNEILFFPAVKKKSIIWSWKDMVVHCCLNISFRFCVFTTFPTSEEVQSVGGKVETW